MWSRQLLYTGVTRARNAVLMLGTERALRHAVDTRTQAMRNTLLEAMLRGGMK
jgi:ATP-dependent exoDNAse (exonuclease V) alpha subunit